MGRKEPVRNECEVIYEKFHIFKGELRGKICLFRGERPLVYVSIFDKIFSMWVMRT